MSTPVELCAVVPVPEVTVVWTFEAGGLGHGGPAGAVHTVRTVVNSGDVEKGLE